MPHGIEEWPAAVECRFWPSRDDEELAFASDGSQLLYRFGHNYNTGSNPGFGIQSAIGVISQDGKMLAYTSDFMNTRGDHFSTVSPATCANPLRGQYAPSSGGCVTVGDYVLPVGNNGAQNIFRAVSGGSQGTCASGQVQEAATLPNWDSSCSHSCTDNGIVWQNQGPNSCRGDIGLMDVTSAHQ